jgi:uncharacterized cupredoxin-like copper-binding protein
VDRRILLAIVAIVAIGGIFFVAQAQSAPHAAQHRTFQLRVVHGTSMTPSALSAAQGDTITLAVSADNKFELHLHGYNRMLELEPGKTATLKFKADAAGSFEMENEDLGHHLGTLTVNPS